MPCGEQGVVSAHEWTRWSRVPQPRSWGEPSNDATIVSNKQLELRINGKAGALGRHRDLATPQSTISNPWQGHCTSNDDMCSRVCDQMKPQSTKSLPKLERAYKGNELPRQTVPQTAGAESPCRRPATEVARGWTYLNVQPKKNRACLNSFYMYLSGQALTRLQLGSQRERYT